MNPPPAPGLVPSSNREEEVWTSNIMETSSQLVSRSGKEAPTAATVVSHTFQGVSRRWANHLFPLTNVNMRSPVVIQLQTRLMIWSVKVYTHCAGGQTSKVSNHITSSVPLP